MELYAKYTKYSYIGQNCSSFIIKQHHEIPGRTYVSIFTAYTNHVSVAFFKRPKRAVRCKEALDKSDVHPLQNIVHCYHYLL